MSAGTHHANGKHVGGANEKPAKPVALAVIHDNIPAELRAKNQWVMWRYECRDDRWTKPPSCAHTGRPASSTDPSSWSTFEVAYAAYRSGDWDGIGFVHLPEDNLTGGDWDGVRNPNTGEIDPDVAAEITRWDTYTEVSPSGTGIRAYARGMKPGARSKQGDFEIYSGLTAEGKPGGRFLTVTGHRLPSSPIAINERQAQIDQSYRERWPDAKPKPNGTQKTNQAGTGNLDDDELLRRAKSAKNGDKFSRLMAGEIGMYGNDESRADLALCGELAFWFGPDPARIDRIFRTSGLMREKWDSRRGEGTYGQRTIAKALSERTEFYSSTRAAPIKPQTQAGSDSEPKGALVNEIQIGPDEHRVISQVTAVIRYDDGLYQRGGKLVRVVRPTRPPSLKDRLKSSGGPRIEPMPLPDLRARITKHCTLMQFRGDKSINVAPPLWLPPAIAAQAAPWDGIRPLESVTETPLLRPDGTILQEAGYDFDTGILYEPTSEFEPIAECLTIEDAIESRDVLLAVVSDVPFWQEMYRSAWLASVLTPLARPAFDGPAPLFLTDANVPGCGKGLSAACAAIIATGRPFATATYSHDPVEMSKTVTACAIAGEPLIMLDNLSGPFGNSTLDAVLTSTEWHGRILGKSEQPRVPLSSVWFATGNNCLIAADTARRTCHIRLHSKEEKPEERDGFTHPDLLGWVRAERPRLLRAALTILAAYCRAGRPQTTMKPWGSFEAWGSIIRQVLVWIELPDPAGTRVALAEESDIDVQTLRSLMGIWADVVPDGSARTVAAVLNEIKGAQEGRFQTEYDALVSALPGKDGGLPTPNRLGHALKKYRGRVCGGKWFEAKTDAHAKTAVWTLNESCEAP